MIIGLAGFARTGKDTVANHLVRTYGFGRRAFADPMREALYRLDPIVETPNAYWSSLRDYVDVFGWERLKEVSPDARGLMQRMGTEVGREMFGQNFWVDLAMKNLPNNTVFSDVRFPNEADAIRERGGVIWQVSRPNVEAANDHVSESALAGYEFDRVINNSGSLNELSFKVDRVLEWM
jgi:hypothetical protein